MTGKEVSRIPVWNIPQTDPGYLYIFKSWQKLKIGKTTNPGKRISEAKTWLPDLEIVGVKPFWNIADAEKSLHSGLALFWYSHEWFHFNSDPYEAFFLDNFCAFHDDEDYRDQNSINFTYWLHEFGEYLIERSRRDGSLKSFQRDTSDVKKLTE